VSVNVPTSSSRNSIVRVNHRIRGIVHFGVRCSVTVLSLKNASVGWRRNEFYKLPLTFTPERYGTILVYRNKRSSRGLRGGFPLVAGLRNLFDPMGAKMFLQGRTPPRVTPSVFVFQSSRPPGTVVSDWFFISPR